VFFVNRKNAIPFIQNKAVVYAEGEKLSLCTSSYLTKQTTNIIDKMFYENSLLTD